MSKENKLPSKSQIGDEVFFVPMQRHLAKYKMAEEETEGKIIAIRFTIAKVFYDIVDYYYGRVYDNIDSCNVKTYADYGQPDPKQEEVL